MIETTNHFHICDYRHYTGYDRRKHSLIKNGDILCMGTCDLASIKPITINPFSWAEMLSQQYKCDQIDEIISMDVAIEYFKEYLVNFSVPKYFCYVIPILGESIMINNTSLGITENSKRVVKYLSIKGFLTDEQTTFLYKKIDVLANTSAQQRIDYVLNKLSDIKKLADTYNIKFLWCPNGTKTANNFYSPLIDEILKNTNCLDNYVGWIENKDLLPDSSSGYVTQKLIYTRFVDKISYD
jgi:hypothetical protein